MKKYQPVTLPDSIYLHYLEHKYQLAFEKHVGKHGILKILSPLAQKLKVMIFLGRQVSWVRELKLKSKNMELIRSFCWGKMYFDLETKLFWLRWIPKKSRRFNS